MDGGQQLGRRLSYLDGAATEEEQKEEEQKEEEEEEEEEEEKKKLCMAWRPIREERYTSTHA